MKSIFTWLFIFISYNCFSQVQTNAQIKQFLNEFVRNYEKVSNLYYHVYLDSRTTDYIVRSLDYKESDSIYRDMNHRKTAFVFSPEEKEQLRKIWLSQKNKAWDSNLIEQASIFKGKPLPENYTREQSREHLKQFEGKNIIEFSTPVFLRNNSLCVFFYGNYDGGSLYIMKKENQKWVKQLWKVIYYN